MMSDENNTGNKPVFKKIKPTPSAGLFGAAGGTKVQPGQQAFDPNKSPVPYKPAEKE
jgi:hypothetical protein